MNVGITTTFRKDAAKFSDDEEKSLETVRNLRKLKSLSESINLRKMKGAKNKYRLRLGFYRIVLTWNKEKQELIAERVALGKDIYKKSHNFG
ncbi:MAG: hypothetical protein LBS43_06465 [Prevotellaceae bacterium]|jgi:mRNA interferase RelE/StbE|nr:hypothetical protein [Prevotellaceae bacterium]